MRRTIILGLTLILLAVVATGCTVQPYPLLSNVNEAYVVIISTWGQQATINRNLNGGSKFYTDYNDAVIDAEAHAPAYIFKLYSKVEIPSEPIVTPINPTEK